MKKNVIYILLLSVLFATASCTVIEKDTSEPYPEVIQKETPKVPIRFQIALPRDGSPTKTMADNPQIKNVVLVVFSDAGYFNEWVVADADTGLATENETEYSLVARLSMSEGTRLRVHIIANCPSELLSNPPITGTSALDVEDAVISRIQSSLGDTWKPDPNNATTYNIEDGYWQKIILPYGIAAEKEENGNSSEDTYKKDASGNLIPTVLTKNQFKMISPIPLVRNFARIQLINRTSNFEIASVGVAYAPARGVIAPIMSTPYYVDQWGARVNVTFADGYEDENGWHDGAATAVRVRNDNSLVANGNTVVPGLHRLGHEIKDPATGDDVSGASVDKFYDELFILNYHNLPLNDPDALGENPTQEQTDEYNTKLTWRKLTEAPYSYEGFTTTPLEFAPNPASDSDLRAYNQNDYFYVYERPKPRTIGGKKENPTRLIVKGRFTVEEGEEPNEYKYYPVDILDPDGSYSALLRNHTYIVLLNSVAPDAGESDITKAPDATGSNVSDDPRTMDLNEVSDGKSSIAVSYIDTTLIKAGQFSVMYRYIPDIKANPVTQSNSTVTLKIGYDGTSAGFVEGTQSANGPTFAGTLANPTVEIEMDGASPKLYYHNGNQWAVATNDDQRREAWSKIIYQTVDGGENDIFEYASSGTIRVEGGKLHRDVRVNITPIKDMVVECADKYLLPQTGQTEHLIIWLPDDLTRSMFPLELKIEPEDETVNPSESAGLPVTSGPSIVEATEGKSSYYYVRTVTRQEYDAITAVNHMKAITCQFTTVKADNATTIWVGNWYFRSQSDAFYNYRKREFHDLAFGAYSYSQKTINFSFNFDNTDANSYWDNDLANATPANRVIPRQVTLILTNLAPAVNQNTGAYIDGITKKLSELNTYIYNVPSKSDTYNENVQTLHFTVIDDTEDISVKLTTDDLAPDNDNPGFVPNPDLYQDATLSKTVSTFTKCDITDMRFENSTGARITGESIAASSSDVLVFFCFNYQDENLQPITFELNEHLEPVNTSVTLVEGNTYRYVPRDGSGDAQRVALYATGEGTATLSSLTVESDQYNTPGTRSFSFELRKPRFTNLGFYNTSGTAITKLSIGKNLPVDFRFDYETGATGSSYPVTVTLTNLVPNNDNRLTNPVDNGNGTTTYTYTPNDNNTAQYLHLKTPDTSPACRYYPCTVAISNADYTSASPVTINRYIMLQANQLKARGYTNSDNTTHITLNNGGTGTPITMSTQSNLSPSKATFHFKNDYFNYEGCEVLLNEATGFESIGDGAVVYFGYTLSSNTYYTRTAVTLGDLCNLVEDPTNYPYINLRMYAWVAKSFTIDFTDSSLYSNDNPKYYNDPGTSGITNLFTNCKSNRDGLTQYTYRNYRKEIGISGNSGGDGVITITNGTLTGCKLTGVGFTYFTSGALWWDTTYNERTVTVVSTTESGATSSTTLTGNKDSWTTTHNGEGDGEAQIDITMAKPGNNQDPNTITAMTVNYAYWDY